ncbi:MAG: DUF262 domain-containing HNH endonuclease family protein [Gemmatimonadota bacterium]|nr:DUF262 domain-containing HNH endonuclease family protein [Gemmatimonadota bacterium]MDE2954015.1 DUF262 domain-containing HNH endonuclease family protein [Gemmatimonadota bacterium]
MENGQKTIRDLFEGSKIFNIPKYQRAYAWEKEHLEDFVDDIENQKLDKDYFFGTILFQEKKEISDDFENIDIVDGQQRITTLIIFMKLLRDQLKRDGKEIEIRRLEDRYICLYGKHKLRVLQDDNDFFKSYILGDNPLSNGNVRTPSQERLRKAKNYLRQRLENYKLETLREFKEKIERTKVLTYSVEDAAEATLIFETTNDRGKTLTNLEKTKSFLMYKTYLVSGNPEDHLDTIQNWFGEIYRDYETIRNRIDDENSILQYHFIAFEKWNHKSEYQNYVQALKNEVNKLVNNNRSEARDFIDRYGRELKESFVTMKELLWDRRPHLLDIFALNRPALFYPLLIKAYKLDGAVGKQNFKRVAQLVEIICFRIFGIRRRRSTTGRESLYRWTRDFNGNFEELINKLKQFVDWYCNNDAFRRYLSSPNFYNEIGSNDKNYLFWKYENHLRAKEHPIFSEMSHDEFNNRDSRTKFSIEHIIPQNPKENKVTVGGSESILPEMNKDFQEEYLHAIGNLTIDPKSANSSKLNHPFEYKNQNYFRKAPLKTQNELIDFLNQETGRWDNISIQKRQEKILEFALDYWDHKKV